MLRQNMRRFRTVEISPPNLRSSNRPASSELDMAKGPNQIDKSRKTQRQPPLSTTPKPSRQSPFVQANSPESKAIEREARVRQRIEFYNQMSTSESIARNLAGRK